MTSGARPAERGIVLPGWRCPALACRAFNGEAKHVLEVCRCCGVPRPAVPSRPRRVILESPYAASSFAGRSVEDHVEYGLRCLRDSLLRGEAPFASHLSYAWRAVLDDLLPYERALGIEAGLAWGPSAEATVVYVDLGVSGGMLQGVERARAEGRPVEFRTLADGCPALEVARYATAPEVWAKLEAGGWF